MHQPEPQRRGNATRTTVFRHPHDRLVPGAVVAQYINNRGTRVIPLLQGTQGEMIFQVVDCVGKGSTNSCFFYSVATLRFASVVSIANFYLRSFLTR